MNAELVRLSEAADFFPKNFGKPRHYNTLLRWSEGVKVRGRVVVLQTETVGTLIYTSRLWAEEFIRECSKRKESQPVARRTGDVSAARRELIARGFHVSKKKRLHCV